MTQTKIAPTEDSAVAELDHLLPTVKTVAMEQDSSRELSTRPGLDLASSGEFDLEPSMHRMHKVRETPDGRGEHLEA